MLKLLTIAGAVCAIAILQSCRGRSERPDGDRFDWLPGDSAPEDFPVEVVRGDFHFEDRDPLYVPDHRVVHPGWGQIRSTHIVGETLKPLPSRLTLTWFSYREDRFYQGDFELPHAELLRLFREGFASPNTGEFETYHRIVVGMAPGGDVALWVSGAGIIRQVAAFNASRVAHPFTDIIDNPDVSRPEYIAMVLAESLGEERFKAIEDEEVPKDLYARLHRRSPWCVRVTGDGTPRSMRLRLSSGEAEHVDWSSGEDSLRDRATPESLRLEWRKPDGAGRSMEATFDISEANRLLVPEGDEPSSAALCIDLQGDKAALSVETHAGSSAAFEHVKTKVYRID